MNAVRPIADPRVVLIAVSRERAHVNSERMFHPRRDAWLTSRRNARTQGA